MVKGPSTRIHRSTWALASENPEKTKFISSVFNKEIAYDEKTGRFFETGYGEGDCVPEDEFCVVDKETGQSVRLTLEEKERIFLDALQVCMPFVVHWLKTQVDWCV